MEGLGDALLMDRLWRAGGRVAKDDGSHPPPPIKHLPDEKQHNKRRDGGGKNHTWPAWVMCAKPPQLSQGTRPLAWRTRRKRKAEVEPARARYEANCRQERSGAR